MKRPTATPKPAVRFTDSGNREVVERALRTMRDLLVTMQLMRESDGPYAAWVQERIEHIEQVIGTLERDLDQP